MKLKEMEARINAVASEMSALAKKEERTDEEESRYDQVIAEFNDLKGKVVELRNKEAERKAALEAARQFEEPDGRRVAGTQPKPGAEEREREQRDTRSIGQRFAESAQLKRFNEHGGRRSDPMEVGSFYHRDGGIQHHADMSPQELRALINTGDLPASYIQPTYVPGFFRGEDLQGSLRSVLINGTTTSDAIVYFRETAFTNNAAGVPQATHTDAGDETPANASVKPESAITFEQDTAPVVTVAHWIPITRQTLQDAAQLRTYVEQRLLDGLALEESDQLLNGAGGDDLEGILGTTGVQDLDDTGAGGSYFFDNPVADAGSPNENFNRILRARVLIRTVGRGRASFVVVNPADNESFLTATNGNQNYYGPGPFSGNGVANLWGLRVVEDENIAAGTVLVGDGRAAAVWDRMQAQILVDTINDQFIRNMLTLLAEERLALTVFRPQAFAVVELAA